MRFLTFLVASLVFSANALASTPDFTNGIDNKWVKILALSIEKQSDQLFTNYLPTSSTKIEIFASSDVRMKKLYAVKSHISHGNSSTALLDEPVELRVTRFQYLSLLDLAARQVNSWENNVVYDISEDCGTYRVVKHLYFHGQTQSVISSCGETTQLPILSEGLGEVVERLEALMNYENL